MRAFVVGAVVAFALMAFAAPALAANTQLAVGTDGTFTAKSLLLYQKSGSALYCRAVWGNAFVRLTVLVPAGATTTILRAHGGKASFDDLQAGDSLNVVGTLQSGADTLLLNATSITDTSITKEVNKSISGTIKSVGDGTFVLPNKLFGATTTVSVGTSTITKGIRTIGLAEVKAGDKVTNVTGTYDYATNVLAADSITIYQDPSVFVPQTFQGTIRTLSGTTLPATITLSTSNADYIVTLPSTAKVLSKSSAATTLSRFAVGDVVRIFGAIRQNNLADIDATIIRDLNF